MNPLDLFLAIFDTAVQTVERKDHGVYSAGTMKGEKNDKRFNERQW
jgi:hypothetical protein